LTPRLVASRRGPLRREVATITSLKTHFNKDVALIKDYCQSFKGRRIEKIEKQGARSSPVLEWLPESSAQHEQS